MKNPHVVSLFVLLVLLISIFTCNSAQSNSANTLSDTINDVARDEVMNPKKSKGKLYDKPRIFNDLLSRQPL